MDISQNVSLASYSTMGLGGNADYLVKVDSLKEFEDAIKWADEKKTQIIVIGGGSNIVWKDEGFRGLVIVNRIKGFEVIDKGEGKYGVVIFAGENWDSVVKRVCDLSLSGIEALSLIPGSAGATPIQNVGAYGQEISRVLQSVHAYDIIEHKYVDLSNEECNFSYRNSRFKKEPGRFYITSITLELNKTVMEAPFYASLDHYLQEHHIEDYSPMSIRDAVVNIRQAKLPDPAKVKNSGSFFGNPIVDASVLNDLQAKYNSEVPSWSAGNGKIKLSAAWLVDKAGFTNYRDPESGMATWPKQSLVLINEAAHSTSDLLSFKKKIVDSVKSQFNIELVQEPELLP